MRVLILGSGGREHALVWKLNQSKLLNKLFIAPGNAGTNSFATNVNLSYNDFKSIGNFSLEEQIDLIIVGPEEPLVNGIVDFFENDKQLKKIKVLGPNKKAAKLEGSKSFAKNFMQKNNIPTAKFLSVNKDKLDHGIEFLNKQKSPYVLKADGLAAGKGVLIEQTLDSAKKSLIEILNGKFGEAGQKVVIEEYLKGIELSVFAIVDGKDYKIIGVAKDYKRIGENNTGLNTGGMGAISPVYFADELFMKKVETQIIIPTIKGLYSENIYYQGFIFFGLMNVNGSPYVIEYNIRLGDPEAEAIIPRMNYDFLHLIDSTINGNLKSFKIKTNPETAATIMLVSGGYPLKYDNGKLIHINKKIKDCHIFHAGTLERNNDIITNGGRVIAITGLGNGLDAALHNAYKNVDFIDFEQKNYRRDIGFDLI